MQSDATGAPAFSTPVERSPAGRQIALHADIGGWKQSQAEETEEAEPAEISENTEGGAEDRLPIPPAAQSRANLRGWVSGWFKSGASIYRTVTFTDDVVP